MPARHVPRTPGPGQPRSFTASRPLPDNPSVDITLGVPAATATVDAIAEALLVALAIPTATADVQTPAPALAITVSVPTATLAGDAIAPALALTIGIPTATATVAAMPPDVVVEAPPPAPAGGGSSLPSWQQFPNLRREPARDLRMYVPAAEVFVDAVPPLLVLEPPPTDGAELERELAELLADDELAALYLLSPV